MQELRVILCLSSSQITTKYWTSGNILPSTWCLTKSISACAVTLQSYSKVLGLSNTLQSTALVHSSHSNQLLWNTVLQRRPSSWQQQWKVTELEYVSLWLIWKYLQRQRCSLLSRPFCGAPRLSVYNHTIWPMISSSRCHSLKLFRYGLDHQRKLAFICSFSLILVVRPFLSVSALRDLLFSSLRPFDLRCWDLVFTIQKERGGGEDEKEHSLFLLCCPFIYRYLCCHGHNYHTFQFTCCAALIISALWIVVRVQTKHNTLLFIPVPFVTTGKSRPG